MIRSILFVETRKSSQQKESIESFAQGERIQTKTDVETTIFDAPDYAVILLVDLLRIKKTE